MWRFARYLSKKKGDYGINSKNLTMTKVKNTAPWAAPRQSQGFWIPRRGFGIPITGFQIFLLELGFRIPTAIFWVPKSRIWIPQAKISKIPDSTGKNFRVSEIRIPLLGSIPLHVNYCCAAVLILSTLYMKFLLYMYLKFLKKEKHGLYWLPIK